MLVAKYVDVQNNALYTGCEGTSRTYLLFTYFWDIAHKLHFVYYLIRLAQHSQFRQQELVREVPAHPAHYHAITRYVFLINMKTAKHAMYTARNWAAC